MVPKEITDVFTNIINPMLAGDGGYMEAIDYNNGDVTVRVGGACRGCLSLDETVNKFVKTELIKNCPNSKINNIIISDSVNPELWEMAKKILNGGKIDE